MSNYTIEVIEQSNSLDVVEGTSVALEIISSDNFITFDTPSGYPLDATSGILPVNRMASGYPLSYIPQSNTLVFISGDQIISGVKYFADSIVSSGSFSLKSQPTASGATHFPVFTNDPSSLPRLVYTRTTNEIKSDLGLSNIQNLALSGINFTAGSGIVGGGNLSSNRSFDIGQGDGISVDADSISVDSTVIRSTNIDQIVSGVKTFSTSGVVLTAPTGSFKKDLILRGVVGSSSNNNIVVTPASNLAGNRTYSLPDAGADADFVMTAGGQIITGPKTFTNSIVFNSGSFQSLRVGDVDVSISGHTHTSSNITNFASSVSGLLPVTSLNAGSGISIVKVGTDYTIHGSGSSGLTQSQVDDRVNTIVSGVYAPLNSPTFTGTVAGISKSMVGLGNVDNTSDVNKPVSTAQASADSAVQSAAASDATTKANNAQAFAIQRSNHTGTQTSSTISDFNTSVSGLVNGIYAPLSSPSFIGVPTAPTASSGTNTTQIASTAFVRTEISNLISAAPSALDTLNELSAALGNDPNFATTITNNLASKANLSGAIFTGSVSGPSGNFTSLKVNNVDVSASGHTHTSSDITNFNSAVSGLLPTIANSGDNRLLTSTGSTVGINAESNLTFNGSLLAVSGNLVANTGTINSLNFNNIGDTDLSIRQLAWNNSEGSLAVGLSDTYEMFLGGELHYRVRNNTGSSILAGTAVYATGLTPGGNNRIEIAPKVADGSIREVRFMGLVTENIDNGVNGFTTHFGYIRNIDTRGDYAANGATNKVWASGEPVWAEGDILYIHPTAEGKLTKIEPKHSISVAIILNRHQSEGKLFVRPTSYGHLGDNHDVDVSGATNGQFLQYNSTTDYWVPSSSGNFTSLSVNSTGVSISGHTHTTSDIIGFVSSVSGLLPVKDITAGTNITISSTSGIYIINSTSSGGGETGNVSGSGINNHIAYWNSTSGIVADSGQLYWDSTFNRLGVGTTTPSASGFSLTVFSQNTQPSDISDKRHEALNVRGGDLLFGGQSPAISLKGYTWFGRNDGSIGIGASHAPVGTFGATSTFFTFQGYNENVTSYNPMCLSAGFFPQIYLNTNGNVGIRTATPSVQLHVIGTGLFSQALRVNNVDVSVSGHTHSSSNINNFNSSVSGLLPVTNIVAGTNVTVSSSGSTFTINSTGGGGGGGISNIVEDTSPQLGGNLDLNSYSVSGVGNININGSGVFSRRLLVGKSNADYTDINNNTATATLAVSGVSYSDSLHIGGVNLGYFGSIDSNGAAIFRSLGVGENNDTPGNFLTVNDTQFIINNNPVLGGILFKAAADSGVFLENSLIINSNSNGPANVGIGTASPSGALHVIGSGIFSQNIRILNVPAGTNETDLILVKSDGTFVKRPSSFIGGGGGISQEDSVINALIFG